MYMCGNLGDPIVARDTLGNIQVTLESITVKCGLV